jgi:hypothetical protein
VSKSFHYALVDKLSFIKKEIFKPKNCIKLGFYLRMKSQECCICPEKYRKLERVIHSFVRLSTDKLDLSTV